MDETLTDAQRAEIYTVMHPPVFGHWSDADIRLAWLSGRIDGMKDARDVYAGQRSEQ